jgi:hypothetical protein
MKSGYWNNRLSKRTEEVSKTSITDIQSELGNRLHWGVYEKSEENEVLFEMRNSQPY